MWRRARARSKSFDSSAARGVGGRVGRFPGAGWCRVRLWEFRTTSTCWSNTAPFWFTVNHNDDDDDDGRRALTEM